jgi:hypothetical protein
MSCQCGSRPGSSPLLVLNLCLDVVDLDLHIVNGVGMSCCLKGSNIAMKGGPNPGPREHLSVHACTWQACMWV